MMLRGVSKSGSPISRWIMSRPFASSAFALTNTSKAVSVPRRAMRFARRSSWPLVIRVKSALSKQWRNLSFIKFAIAGRIALENLQLTQASLQFSTLKRGLPFIILVGVVVLIAALGVHIDWTWKRKLSPRGGRYFFHRVELAVPSFHQSEEKWRDDPLGGVADNGTLGGEGCAVAAAAMVFKFYGIDVDPQQLNWFLTATGGYTDQGWLYWDRAVWFAPDWPAASRILSSSRGKTASIISCAIPAPVLRKSFIHYASLAVTSRRCDFISRSRIRVLGCRPRDEDRS